MIFETAKEFYEDLKKDYDRHKVMEETEPEIYSKKTLDAKTVKRSFVFDYFSKWRDRIADKYVGDKGWVDKYIINVDFTKTADFAKSFPKKTYPDRPDKYSLLYAAHKLFSNGGIGIDKYKSVFTYIAEKEGSKKKMIKKVREGGKEAVDETYEELSYVLLRDGMISDNLKKEFNEDSLDEINLLYEYCKYKGIDGAVADDALSDEHIEKCQELFELLLASHSDRVLLPLYVDPSSGAGVYIIGSYHLNLSETEKAGLPELKNCGIYTASFSESVGYDDYYEVADGSVKSVNMLFSHELKSFETVKDAFADLRENREDEYYYGYQNENNAFYDIVKEKFGETFLRCFDSPHERREIEKESAIKESEKRQELAEIKEKYNKDYEKK